MFGPVSIISVSVSLIADRSNNNVTNYRSGLVSFVSAMFVNVVYLPLSLYYQSCWVKLRKILIF